MFNLLLALMLTTCVDSTAINWQQFDADLEGVLTQAEQRTDAKVFRSESWKQELKKASARAAHAADVEIMGKPETYMLRGDSLWVLIGKQRIDTMDYLVCTEWKFVGLVAAADTLITRTSEKRIAEVQTWQ